MTERPDRNRKEASEYLRKRWQLSFVPNTLARMAATGQGPVYYYRGRFAFYAQAELDAWARTKISAPKRKTRRTVPGRAA
jgi:hypothetical protein